MKLYVTPVSPNCRLAEAVASHLALDVEVIVKSIQTGELKTPEFLALNPNGRVPTLADGDFSLWESRDIAFYLADRNEETTFFPRDLKQRADIMRWVFWEAQHFNRAISTITWETVAKPMMNMGEPDKKLIEEGLESFNTFAPILNVHLEGKSFITGDTLTLADFAVGSHSSLVQAPGSQIPLDQYPNIASWYKRLGELPAWQATKPPFE